MNQGESPPPTSKSDKRLDDILSGFRPTDSEPAGLKKPGNRVVVKKKGATGRSLSSIKGLLSSKSKSKEPNCAKRKNLSVSASGGALSINCEGCAFSSDLSDPECRLWCSKLSEVEAFENLILDDGYYKKEYGKRDVEALKEVKRIADSITVGFPEECGLCAKEHEMQVEKLRTAMLRDPRKLLYVGVEVREDNRMVVKGVEHGVCKDCRKRTEDAVRKAFSDLEGVRLVKGHSFSPVMRPFFANSRVLFEIPKMNNVEDSYDHEGSKVVLSKGEEEVYSIFPPEYRLGRNSLGIMKLAYEAVLRDADQLDEKQFASRCRREILSAAGKRGARLSEEDCKLMTENLVRCTLGLDIIELLLKDQNLQDVYINSPIDTTPLYVKHKDFDDCRTNVFLSEQAARNMISKFRLKSGRAFSEVSPILDMELPEFGARVNITGPPISPDGLAFAFRRASEEPWTLLRFIENRMISPMAAGLLGMMVNEETAILMCGDRGSGKTSMLTALVGAMPTKYRILTLEDTFEIPVPALASEGFRIQRMRVKPSTAGDSFEKGADDAMRSLLRMGDSAIVMGEVRGQEAKTLYEAMNVGGSGNCVLGTIHGKSPRSLLERVVFSLGVPAQSFKATDLVVIADRLRPGGGSKKLRRVTEIVEVGKSWKEPDAGKVFSTLMGYDQDDDSLAEEENLKKPERSEVIRKIAGRRGLRPKSILADIKARAEAYGHAVELFKKTGDRRLLTLKTMIDLNQRYLQLVDDSIEEYGRPDYQYVAESAIEWLDLQGRGHMKVEIGVSERAKAGMENGLRGESGSRGENGLRGESGLRVENGL